jgi:hypothetical protein
MATKISIYNQALMRLGCEPVEDFTDGTKACKALNMRYDDARRYVLRRHPWNFAVKRVAHSDTDTVGPDFGFAYSHSFPLDCIRILNIECDLDYKIEGRKILSDDSTVNLRYIWDVDNDTLFDAGFAETLAAYLAWDISYYMTQSKTLKADLWEEFKRILSAAKSNDAQEEPAEEVGADYYLEARLAGTSATPKRDWGT